jgi:hypothetical protein
MLDHLPASDPAAQRSRRDLVRINALMLQPVIMASLLKRHVARPPRTVLEIGAGDGSFSLAWARRLKERWPKTELILLDKTAFDAPAHERIRSFGWTVRPVTADIFAWLAGQRPRVDLVVANLFLHHFEVPQLARIFAALAGTVCFVATEPRRNRFAYLASLSLGAVGANKVSRHDAPASVRAGFRDRELTALWQAPGTTYERAIGPFTHAFAAVRR